MGDAKIGILEYQNIKRIAAVPNLFNRTRGVAANTCLGSFLKECLVNI